MITKCIIVWATILNNFSIGLTPSIYEMTDMKDCEQVMPKSCLKYAQDLVEHFDEENIETADSSGSLIDDIEIVKHDWIASDDKVRYGVIAQDLFEVVPEAVSRGTDGDFVEEDLSGDEMPTKQVWGVDYSKLVPLLVKEVQELRARVAELEA